LCLTAGEPAYYTIRHWGSVESQSAVACKRARRACSLATGSLALAPAIADTPEGAKKSYALLAHQNARGRFDWGNPLSAAVMTAKKLAEGIPDFLLSPI